MTRLWAVAAALFALSCSHPERPPVHLVVGSEPGEDKSFVPSTSLAEYVALPGLRNELRITLASYVLGCERFVVPPPGQALVNVVITTLPDDPPTTRSYAWADATAPERALPSVDIGNRAYEFPPGGEIRLDHVELDPHGRIDGVLAFSFAGDAKQSAKSLAGVFSARICRFSGPP